MTLSIGLYIFELGQRSDYYTLSSQFPSIMSDLGHLSIAGRHSVHALSIMMVFMNDVDHCRIGIIIHHRFFVAALMALTNWSLLADPEHR